MALKAISIDDDPMSILVIEKLAEKSGEVDLINTYTDPVKGAAGIIIDQPDILFLDIEMPEFDGIQILSALIRPPKVIVVSANPDFEEKALQLNAVSFIHKPANEETFGAAVAKAKELIDSGQ